MGQIKFFVFFFVLFLISTSSKAPVYVIQLLCTFQISSILLCNFWLNLKRRNFESFITKTRQFAIWVFWYLIRILFFEKKNPFKCDYLILTFEQCLENKQYFFAVNSNCPTYNLMGKLTASSIITKSILDLFSCSNLYVFSFYSDRSRL
jgi:hypothetical protein